MLHDGYAVMHDGSRVRWLSIACSIYARARRRYDAVVFMQTPSGTVREEGIMATGWAGDGAVQDQIDATVKDGIQRVRSRLPQGPGLERCEECDAAIPQARREAVPGVRLCVDCQDAHDKGEAGHSGYNRRGSKDSQLR
jgi:phage/conjugal plasmid C-4 type zinc finger TraR family protein